MLIFMGPTRDPAMDPLIHRGELILAGAANGANPIRRQFVKGGVGGHPVVRVSLGRVIDITADFALVFLHGWFLFQAGGEVKSRIRSGPPAKESR